MFHRLEIIIKYSSICALGINDTTAELISEHLLDWNT